MPTCDITDETDSITSILDSDLPPDTIYRKLVDSISDGTIDVGDLYGDLVDKIPHPTLQELKAQEIFDKLFCDPTAIENLFNSNIDESTKIESVLKFLKENGLKYNFLNYLKEKNLKNNGETFNFLKKLFTNVCTLHPGYEEVWDKDYNNRRYLRKMVAQVMAFVDYKATFNYFKDTLQNTWFEFEEISIGSLLNDSTVSFKLQILKTPYSTEPNEVIKSHYAVAEALLNIGGMQFPEIFPLLIPEIFIFRGNTLKWNNELDSFFSQINENFIRNIQLGIITIDDAERMVGDLISFAIFSAKIDAVTFDKVDFYSQLYSLHSLGVLAINPLISKLNELLTDEKYLPLFYPLYNALVEIWYPKSTSLRNEPYNLDGEIEALLPLLIKIEANNKFESLNILPEKFARDRLRDIDLRSCLEIGFPTEVGASLERNPDLKKSAILLDSNNTMDPDMITKYRNLLTNLKPVSPRPDRKLIRRTIK
ncbi:MAG: hypothetical protein WC501_03245 [Candidatus Micrarchaeia archaeon]